MQATKEIYLRAAERAELHGVTNHENSWSDKDTGYPERMCMGGHILTAAYGTTCPDNVDNLFEVFDPLDANLEKWFGRSNTSHTFSATHNRFEVADKLREIAATLPSEELVPA